MISKIFIKFILFVISWMVSGMALFVATFSTCATGKIHEKIVEGSLILFRFLISTVQVFISSRDIKKVAEAISSTFSEMMKLSAQNIEIDYQQVLIVFAIAYFTLKLIAGLLSMLRRKIKLRSEKTKLPPVSKTPIHEKDEFKEQVDPADRTILTTGGY